MSTYDDIAKHHGNILHKESLGDQYSGDHVYLVQQVDPFDSWYGIVVLGYGSCSMCDTMEAIMEMPLEQSIEAVQELRAESAPTWYNKTGMIHFLKEDANTQWWYHMYGGSEFTQKCLDALNA